MNALREFCLIILAFTWPGVLGTFVLGAQRFARGWERWTRTPMPEPAKRRRQPPRRH